MLKNILNIQKQNEQFFTQNPFYPYYKNSPIQQSIPPSQNYSSQQHSNTPSCIQHPLQEQNFQYNQYISTNPTFVERISQNSTHTINNNSSQF